MKASLILIMLKLLHLQNPSPQQMQYFEALSEADIKAGQIYKIDPVLIVVMQYRESSLRQFAESKDKKDLGGMQIRWWDKETYVRSQLFDPWVNTLLGVRYLRQKINQCGGLTRGLAAYNRGHCTKHLTYGRRTVALYKRLMSKPIIISAN